MGEAHGDFRDRSANMPENDNDDDEDDMALEQDPSHRFSRYQQKVGSGRFKRVYRGFDEKNGIDVAWSKIERHINNMELDDETMERITAEMSKGLQLEHPNIIKCFRCDALPACLLKDTTKQAQQRGRYHNVHCGAHTDAQQS